MAANSMHIEDILYPFLPYRPSYLNPTNALNKKDVRVFCRTLQERSVK